MKAMLNKRTSRARCLGLFITDRGIPTLAMLDPGETLDKVFCQELFTLRAQVVQDQLSLHRDPQQKQAAQWLGWEHGGSWFPQ